MIMWNGLDSTKEHMYSSGLARSWPPAGISTLMVDCPGSGEALRFHGLTARVETEDWAAACVDYLRDPRRRRPARIGLVGWSLGGYYAPRAAAFEKRLTLVVAWGANHNWGEVQQRAASSARARTRSRTTGSTSCGCGARRRRRRSSRYAEAGPPRRRRRDRSTVPFLITHGENDRQIPLAYAHHSYEQAVNSPKRELRVFTPDEGGAEHIGLDHLPHVSAYIADWIADTFADLA